MTVTRTTATASAAGDYLLRMKRTDIAERMIITDRILTQINYGLDLINRLSSTYKPGDKIDNSIVTYLDEYEAIRSMFSTESLGIEPGMENVLDVIVRSVRSLWAMLCKLWDNLRHCFHYLFSAQYRAQSRLIGFRKEIAVCGNSNDDKFKAFVTDASITLTEFKAIIKTTDVIVSMLEGLAKQESIDAIDHWIAANANKSGLKFADGRFEDTLGDVEYKSGTYGSLGWSIKDTLDATATAITCVGRQVKLRNMVKELEADISAIKRDIGNKVERGATAETLSEVETKLAFNTKMFRMLQAGLLALSGRLTQIDVIIGDIAEDCKAIATGEFETVDD